MNPEDRDGRILLLQHVRILDRDLRLSKFLISDYEKSIEESSRGIIFLPYASKSDKRYTFVLIKAALKCINVSFSSDEMNGVPAEWNHRERLNLWFVGLGVMRNVDHSMVSKIDNIVVKFVGD